MKVQLRTTLSLLTLLLPALWVPAPAWALAEQEPPKEEQPIQDERPEVAGLIKALAEQVDAKGKQDREAQGTLDSLSTEFAKSGPKDRAAMVKAVARILTVPRKDLAKDLPDEELKTYAGVILGRMGPESADELIGHLGNKKLRECPKAHRAVVLALGQTQVEKAIKPLLKLINDGEWTVAAAGAEALGNFTAVDQKVRKAIFDELLNRIIHLADVIETDQGQNNFGGANDYEQMVKEFEILRGPIRSTLEKLSKHSEQGFLQWRSWWNDNKKKDWDASA